MNFLSLARKKKERRTLQQTRTSLVGKKDYSYSELNGQVKSPFFSYAAVTIPGLEGPKGWLNCRFELVKQSDEGSPGGSFACQKVKQKTPEWWLNFPSLEKELARVQKSWKFETKQIFHSFELVIILLLILFHLKQQLRLPRYVPKRFFEKL